MGPQRLQYRQLKMACRFTFAGETRSVKFLTKTSCRTVENVNLWQRLWDGAAMWHLSTSNDLDHQRLINRLKLTTHHDLVVVGLLYDELQTVFLPSTNPKLSLPAFLALRHTYIMITRNFAALINNNYYYYTVLLFWKSYTQGTQSDYSFTHSLTSRPSSTADDHSIVFLLHCSLSCDNSFSWM